MHALVLLHKDIGVKCNTHFDLVSLYGLIAREFISLKMVVTCRYHQTDEGAILCNFEIYAMND